MNIYTRWLSSVASILAGLLLVFVVTMSTLSSCCTRSCDDHMNRVQKFFSACCSREDRCCCCSCTGFDKLAADDYEEFLTLTGLTHEKITLDQVQDLLRLADLTLADVAFIENDRSIQTPARNYRYNEYEKSRGSNMYGKKLPYWTLFRDMTHLGSGDHRYTHIQTRMEKEGIVPDFPYPGFYDGATLMHFVAFKGSVSLLREFEFDMNAFSNSGLTPLTYVMNFPYQLQKQMKTKRRRARSSRFNTFVMHDADTVYIAERDMDRAMEQHMIRRGADPHILDASGATQLHNILYREARLTSLRTLADSFDREARDRLVHYIPHEMDRLDVTFEELIATYTLDVNVQDDKGFTPLHVAAIHNLENYVSILLKHQARLNLVDGKGRTAAQCAQEYGNKHVARLIKKVATKKSMRKKYSRRELRSDVSSDSTSEGASSRDERSYSSYAS